MTGGSSRAAGHPLVTVQLCGGTPAHTGRPGCLGFRLCPPQPPSHLTQPAEVGSSHGLLLLQWEAGISPTYRWLQGAPIVFTPSVHPHHHPAVLRCHSVPISANAVPARELWNHSYIPSRTVCPLLQFKVSQSLVWCAFWHVLMSWESLLLSVLSYPSVIRNLGLLTFNLHFMVKQTSLKVNFNNTLQHSVQFSLVSPFSSQLWVAV